MSSVKNLRVPTFEQVQVNTSQVVSSEEFLDAEFVYESVEVERDAKRCLFSATPTRRQYHFRTSKTVPKVGVMFVGWGGNNGSTVTAGVLANREGITWRTRKGVEKPDYLGSLTQASTVRLGTDKTTGEDVFVPMNAILPMLNPNDLVIGGWDISSLNLAQAMQRAAVLDFDLQRQLAPLMQEFKPLPSVYSPDFIAANQKERADNLMKASTKKDQIAQIRSDIRQFKANNQLDKVIVLWTANTERFAEVRNGLNDTWENLSASIEANEDEISPSTLFCIASLQEGCSYINGSPQNTFVPGLVEFSLKFPGQYIGGDDFKSGQTKMKSVLTDFLISAGIKPTSIVSYNHLGNNDGKNLNAPAQFRSKEISKSNVVDDMVASNNIMYEEGEHPDHCVVIKYVPNVGDSKRAMDEYTSKIFMGGTNTIVLHNTCEDSLLAAPLMLDLVILTELFERIQWKPHGHDAFESFHPVLSPLSYLLKAPMVPPNTPVVNALARQRAAIENILKACAGLPPDNSMMLEHRARTPFLSSQ